MGHNRAPKQGSKWYLPYDTYRYVVDFCYAYGDMCRRLEDLDGKHSHAQDGMPRGSETSDPTYKEAVRRMKLSEKIRIIEDAVETAVPEEEYGKTMKYHLFLGVTKRGITYKYLYTKLGMPCGHTQFSELRRKVYWLIAERIM